MQKISSVELGNGPYPNFYIRLVICLVIGHFMVSFGERENIFELLQLSYYYPALGSSFLITTIICEFIHYCNQNLDANYSWRTKTRKRLIMQILVCGIIAVALAAILAMIYFKANHISITDTSYFRYDFTVIICFVAILNLYSIVVNLYELKILSRKNLSNKYRTGGKNIIDTSMPAIIYSVNRVCFDLKFDGEKLGTYKSLKEALASLPSSDYFLVNRSLIVHRLCINDYVPSDSNTLKLNMKDPFEGMSYYVSQRNAVAFKRWFNGNEEIG
ncbi:LytTR family DNA-binding domain-containing protein [Pedobacter mendelii]|nr:LytTR family DNA-binding domain-containing protein [Pedobacter mendelii]